MTIAERLLNTGRALIGRPFIKREVIEVEKQSKDVLGTSIDLFKSASLVTETKASAKLLEANDGWVYKNNDVIASEVGAIEFELYTVKVVGDEVVMDPILQHPLLDALDRFNDFTSASDGFYITESHKNLAGDAFWYVDRNGLDIRGIYLLTPDKVTIVLGKVIDGQRAIQAYKFIDSVGGERIEQTYDAKDIIHFKAPNPSNPYRGKSKVAAAAETIDTDNYAVEASKGQFKRGMIGNFFLSTDKSLTDEQIKGLRAQLKANHQGAANSYSTVIMSGGLKPESVQLTSRDMEFIAQQTWLRDKIMSIFGNNRAVLGITDDVNRANADATILNWKQTTIKTEMKAITDTLQEFFTPMFGDNLLLGFKDPVPENKVENTDTMVKLVNASLMSINEAREELGMDPIEGGDEMGFQRQERQAKEQADRMGQQNQQNQKPVPKAIANTSYEKALRRMGVTKQVQQFLELKAAATPIAKKAVKGRTKEEAEVAPREHVTFTNEKVWGFHNKQIRVVEAAEQIFSNKLKQFLDGLMERALANVPDEFAAMQNKALIDPEDELVKAMIDFTPLLTDVAIQAGVQALELINDEDPYIPLELRDVIERSVKKFAESMIATDREYLIDIIAEGVKNGDSVAKIRKAMTDQFSQFSKMQAERITRTEVIRASNSGALDAWKHSDEVVAKQWLTAEDDRVDPLCAYMNGKVQPVSSNFFDVGDSLNVGDTSTKFEYDDVTVPPLHPNCRCTLLPILQGENAFDAKTYLKIKGAEADQTELEKLRAQNAELTGYVKELEDYLET